MKKESPTLQNSPSALKALFLASRPKTWIASISPVLIGTAMAATISLPIFALTLAFSLLIQIGTNYANDYFDFMNGADSHLRNGPKRATMEGWLRPHTMKLTTGFIFACAFCVGLPLMAIAGWWSYLLAALCIAFGVLYTGGPKPLGYLGLGEVLVFVFFGPVATCGTYFLQMKEVSMAVLVASFSPGLLSCALLAINNLRDKNSDAIARKNTLVVRWGRTFGSFEYAFCVCLAAIVPLILVFVFQAPIWLLLASLALLGSYPCIIKAFTFQDPLELIAVLQKTAMFFIAYTFLFACIFLNTKFL